MVGKPNIFLLISRQIILILITSKILSNRTNMIKVMEKQLWKIKDEDLIFKSFFHFWIKTMSTII